MAKVARYNVRHEMKMAISEALGLDPQDIMQIDLQMRAAGHIEVTVKALVTNELDKKVSEIIRSCALVDLEQEVAGG